MTGLAQTRGAWPLLDEALANVADADADGRAQVLDAATRRIAKRYLAGELPDVSPTLVASAVRAGLSQQVAARTVARAWTSTLRGVSR